MDDRGLGRDQSPRVVAFFHGQQMLVLAARRHLGSAAVLVSRSRDGDLQTGVMRVFGFTVVRGSSSRGGAGGFRGLLRALRAGSDLLFAVDGPRGPVGTVKPGALAAARSGGVPIVTVAAAASRCRVLSRTWDRFVVPLPFSKVVVHMASPLVDPLVPVSPTALSSSLEELTARSRALLVKGPVPWQSRAAGR